MNSLLLLVPLSLVLVVAAGWAFAWAVRRGQFDDLDTPALDILVDDVRVDDARVDDPARAALTSSEPVDAYTIAAAPDAQAERGDA